MCRNIKTLFNYNPPASNEEIRDAATQYVRKISGFVRPSKKNETTFFNAVDDIAQSTRILIQNLVTEAPLRDRQKELAGKRAHRKSVF